MPEDKERDEANEICQRVCKEALARSKKGELVDVAKEYTKAVLKQLGCSKT